MKLDRNINPDGKGKYALILLRKGDVRYDDSTKTMSMPKEMVDWGDAPDTEFFVIRLKDKHAAAALGAYAMAARRMKRLTGVDAEYAWEELAKRLEPLSEKDVPKFDDLYRAIRGVTIVGAQKRIFEITEAQWYGNQTEPTEGPEAA